MWIQRALCIAENCQGSGGFGQAVCHEKGVTLFQDGCWMEGSCCIPLLLLLSVLCYRLALSFSHHFSPWACAYAERVMVFRDASRHMVFSPELELWFC